MATAHIYLRASTTDQDATRAEKLLLNFAQQQSMQVAGIYAENISGTKLERPELFKLLDAAQAGDVLLVESVDRLSRLSQADWESLKTTIKAKGLRLVVVDLPTSHQLIADKGITGQIMDVINGMLIDLMATMARLDQEKRVERIKQGLENKRQRGEKIGGRPKDQESRKRVADLLGRGNLTVDEVAKLAGVGVATVYRIKKELTAV
ncbi:resolvase [Pseudomonas sp. T]|nr:resolvase [Pseudomonas sp. T]